MKAGSKNKVLEIALHNCVKKSDNEWYCVGTPVEQMALIKLGAYHQYYTNASHIAYIVENIKAGRSYKSWFWFSPKGELKSILEKMYPNSDKRGH